MNEALLGLELAQIQVRVRAIEVLLTTTLSKSIEKDPELRATLEGLLGYLRGYLNSTIPGDDQQLMQTYLTSDNLRRLIEEAGKSVDPPLEAKSVFGVVPPVL